MMKMTSTPKLRILSVFDDFCLQLMVEVLTLMIEIRGSHVEKSQL